jgi:hypothetical protein
VRRDGARMGAPRRGCWLSGCVAVSARRVRCDAGARLGAQGHVERSAGLVHHAGAGATLVCDGRDQLPEQPRSRWHAGRRPSDRLRAAVLTRLERPDLRRQVPMVEVRDRRCPGGETTCLYASQVYSVTIPEPPRGSTGWIPGLTRARSAYLSATQARGIVRRAIRREAGRSTRNLEYRCGRKARTTFVCESSWSERKHVWVMRVTVKARGNRYVYSARGRRASRSCLERAPARRCVSEVRWPPRRLRRARV